MATQVDDEFAEAQEAAVERDLELFVRVASHSPGIVRTLRVLVGELEGDLPADVQRDLGEHLQRMGATLVRRADRVVLDDRDF